MLGRKALFWLAVAGVAVGANFALELLAYKFPHPGLVRFVEFTHSGPGRG
jgi:hypothetical protein